MPIAAATVADRIGATARWQGIPLIRARSRFMDWGRWQKAFPAASKRPAKWLTVETRAQALDAAIGGAGIALMDMAYLGPHAAAGKIRMLAERPLQLAAGYYFVHAADARNTHLLALFRDWVVEAARPFRSEAGQARPSIARRHG